MDSRMKVPDHATLEELVESGQLGWSILESMPFTSLVAFDRDLKIVAAAGPILRNVGLEPGGMVGRHVRDVLPAPLYDRYVPHYGLAIAGESSMEEEVTPEGSVFTSQFTPIKNGNNEVIGGYVLSLDVTQQRAADDLRRQFETAFEDAPIGMALVELDGTFMKVNRALCEITGYENGELLAKTFQEITHPDDLDADEAFIRQVLAGDIERYSMDKRYFTAKGEEIWVSLFVSLVRGVDGEPLYFLSQIKDISDRKRMEDSLHRLADHDPLTGLWNRRRFEEELSRQVARSQRYGERAAYLLMDLNDFKPVNDAHGHKAGDQLLVAIAEALSKRLRESDSLARIGGDEFAVLLSNVSKTQANLLAEELRRAVELTTISVPGGTVGVTASIGVALMDDTVKSDDAVFVEADQAMYRAKPPHAGR